MIISVENRAPVFYIEDPNCNFVLRKLRWSLSFSMANVLEFSDKLEKVAEKEARNEITDYTTYARLSKTGKNLNSKKVFSELRRDGIRAL
jgi:hypothetical protein